MRFPKCRSHLLLKRESPHLQSTQGEPKFLIPDYVRNNKPNFFLRSMRLAHAEIKGLRLDPKTKPLNELQQFRLRAAKLQAWRRRHDSPANLSPLPQKSQTATPVSKNDPYFPPEVNGRARRTNAQAQANRNRTIISRKQFRETTR